MELADPRVPKSVKNAQMISHGDDSTILAMFSDEYVLNEYRTEHEGKAIHDKMVQVSLEYPGTNLSNFFYRFIVDKDFRGNEWTQRFPKQWEAFMAQKEQVPDGMPIEIWSPLDKGRVMQLKSVRVHTVEQIAGLTDMNGPNIGMDWRKLRDMAKATLEPHIGAVEVSKLTKENEDLKRQMEILQRQFADLANRQESKPRGRPKTIQAA